eukprot:CAMPEP_0115290810 /NCGR_PEP_ID=MMETSP0270-20121206/64260_1 /TAXON_ID=71861 /ORGANISM="Scrippsiella trochoidea, Strain CCMP3099" /LENGTH=126 /DNA_ID=CAMNT_0002708119 /DNA_START=104 /DNA_END=481 /DNA_ORIENTATION=-
MSLSPVRVETPPNKGPVPSMPVAPEKHMLAGVGEAPASGGAVLRQALTATALRCAGRAALRPVAASTAAAMADEAARVAAIVAAMAPPAAAERLGAEGCGSSRVLVSMRPPSIGGGPPTTKTSFMC